MTRLPKLKISLDGLKEAVLPEDYELSTAFIDDKHSHELNRIYRGKDKPTNVLSFSLSENSGEILIDLVTARKEAPTFDMTFEGFVKYLFIHALLHLKGMQHGAKMERAEKKLLHGSSNSNWDRHRNILDKGNRRRKGR